MKSKKLKKWTTLLTCATALTVMTACSQLSSQSTGTTSSSKTSAVTATTSKKTNKNNSNYFTSKDSDTSYNESSATKIKLSGSSADVSGDGAALSGSTVTISKAGTYVISGKSDGGVVWTIPYKGIFSYYDEKSRELKVYLHREGIIYLILLLLKQLMLTNKIICGSNPSAHL